MNVVCPYCRIEGSIDDRFRGGEIRCPKCQQVFVAGEEAPETIEEFHPAEVQPPHEEPARHLQWYFAQDNKPVGPISEDDFHRLAHEGVITADTLVWNQTLAGWQQYGSLAADDEAYGAPSGQADRTPAGSEDQAPSPPDGAHADADDAPSSGQGQAVCSQCQGTFAPDEVMRIGSVTLCSVCKPLYYQKIRQEVALPPRVQFAGFWVRFVAKLIDGMVVVVAGGILSYIVGLLFPGFLETQALTLSSIRGSHSLIELLVGVGYSTFFVGRFAATPGKMALGLKIISPAGGKVTYPRAFARHWGEMLSALLLGVGYIMVAFDPEKRALHDRICGTRVVRERD